jgi:hypothetical protein
MVQRYDLKEDWVTGCIDLEKDADGDWVGHRDYAKLEAKLREFAEQVINEPCSKVTEEMAREILGI